MSLVQTQMVRLAQRVDPYTKDGTELTSANIGSTPGDRFTAQRLLDCYNEARIALAQVISTMMPQRAKAIAVSGNIVRVSNQSITAGVLTKPAGYIEAISLFSTATGTRIWIIPESVAFNLKLQESALTPIVIEEATGFRSDNGNTYIPDGSTYDFRYFGITQFSLTDVSGSPTTQESFNPMWEPLLIQLAEAIADEQGSPQVNALAARLVESKR